MSFFQFDQNNSGGIFDLDLEGGITCCIIIEAINAEEANDKFQDIVENYGASADCDCCGERWDCYVNDEDAKITPKINGKDIEEYIEDKESFLWMEKGREVCIHYSDGRREWN